MPMYYTSFSELVRLMVYCLELLLSPIPVYFTNRLRMMAAANTNTTQAMWNGKLYVSMYGAAIGSC